MLACSSRVIHAQSAIFICTFNPHKMSLSVHDIYPSVGTCIETLRHKVSRRRIKSFRSATFQYGAYDPGLPKNVNNTTVVKSTGQVMRLNLSLWQNAFLPWFNFSSECTAVQLLILTMPVNTEARVMHTCSSNETSAAVYFSNHFQCITDRSSSKHSSLPVYLLPAGWIFCKLWPVALVVCQLLFCHKTKQTAKKTCLGDYACIYTQYTCVTPSEWKQKLYFVPIIYKWAMICESWDDQW